MMDVNSALAKKYYDWRNVPAVPPAQCDTSKRTPKFESILDIYAHLQWMCLQIEDMDDREKAARWLGFVQGVLWANGVYSLDELRHHVNITMKELESHGTKI